MAFTRKFLSALGIEADKVDEIIAAHTEVTDALKEDRDKYKADAEKLPEVEKELNALKKKAASEDPYKDKFDELKKEFDTFKADVEAKAVTAKKEGELRKILKSIGIPEKRIDAVLKVSDVNKIELDEEGNIKDGDKLKESLKTEWSDFIATTKTEGVQTVTPPANPSNAVKSKKEIMEIKDTAERQKAWKDLLISNNNGGN